jgi:hypothetical protein
MNNAAHVVVTTRRVMEARTTSLVREVSGVALRRRAEVHVRSPSLFGNTIRVTAARRVISRRCSHRTRDWSDDGASIVLSSRRRISMRSRYDCARPSMLSLIANACLREVPYEATVPEPPLIHETRFLNLKSRSEPLRSLSRRPALSCRQDRYR